MEKHVNNKVVQLLAKYPSASILATGHCLGGAIAMVSAMKLKENLPQRKV